jgi:hypothetical protein
MCTAPSALRISIMNQGLPNSVRPEVARTRAELVPLLWFPIGFALRRNAHEPPGGILCRTAGLDRCRGIEGMSQGDGGVLPSAGHTGSLRPSACWTAS